MILLLFVKQTDKTSGGLKKNSDTTGLGLKGTNKGQAARRKFVSCFPISLADRVVLLCLVFLLCSASIKCQVLKNGTLLKAEYECFSGVVYQKLISSVGQCPWVI